MSGNHSRRKGSSAELQLAAAIHRELGVRLQRRVEQARSGGHDLEVHPEESGPVAAQLRRYAVEVKRASKASPALVQAWWRQAAAQALAACRVPCLAYREDRQGWRFVVPLQELHLDMPAYLMDSTDYCAELSLLGWAALVREGGCINTQFAGPSVTFGCGAMKSPGCGSV